MLREEYAFACTHPTIATAIEEVTAIVTQTKYTIQAHTTKSLEMVEQLPINRKNFTLLNLSFISAAIVLTTIINFTSKNSTRLCVVVCWVVNDLVEFALLQYFLLLSELNCKHL